MKSLRAFLERPSHRAVEILSRRVSVIEQTLARSPRQGSGRDDTRVSPDRDDPAIADLLAHLPKIATNGAGAVDFAASNAIVLARLADNAESSGRIVLRGMSAIGSLMASASHEIEDGSLTADAVEALGAFMSEMSELSGMLLALQSNCRRALPLA